MPKAMPELPKTLNNLRMNLHARQNKAPIPIAVDQILQQLSEVKSARLSTKPRVRRAEMRTM